MTVSDGEMIGVNALQFGAADVVRSNTARVTAGGDLMLIPRWAVKEVESTYALQMASFSSLSQNRFSGTFDGPSHRTCNLPPLISVTFYLDTFGSTTCRYPLAGLKQAVQDYIKERNLNKSGGSMYNILGSKDGEEERQEATEEQVREGIIHDPSTEEEGTELRLARIEERLANMEELLIKALQK